ncbi:bifunctional [glutamate--ammonia ligase]-adenylyl-L-tyrosine phosphorylase/[glutamate--ammonia-ligase] adenylyltransferase [Ectothiorhodospiraceae bacterium WFHF3C12]|nr:bifunctional [glutamate--ammonia ligase]-adenylyl-L-tyrosine phosphorylase/[glutamate--ammonia-ligase] adenylyltransferase [Ectothiorhodospiraceae bacterium WFHF3C12]
MTQSQPYPAALADALDGLPETLRGSVTDRLGEYADGHALPQDTDVLATLPLVWGSSEFVARTCVRMAGLLDDLASGDLVTAYEPDGYRQRLEAATAEADSQEALGRALRRFRVRETVRLAWRDIAGWDSLEDTLWGLSALAETCIDLALHRTYEWHCERFGVPRNDNGDAQQMVVFGMGKLGGGELNFSSDIDLIFAFPEKGQTDGRRGMANEEFFTRMGRALINLLDATTADGTVYRVDMRLRPYGDSGPLAMSFPAMELYYQDQGREWERYALIKARAVGGDYHAGASLLEDLRPFVYRRYLDYGALEQLRDMKALISRQMAQEGMERNIKLGIGGIREVEFIGQAFQLIRGGRDPNLRERRLLPVLAYLGEEDLLPEHAVRELTEGYRYLRRVENRLQALYDRQTHELPEGELDRQRLATAMGYPDWASLHAELEDLRQRIHGHFDQVFMAPQSSETGSEEPGLEEVWMDQLDDERAESVLAETGFRDPAEILRVLDAMRESNHCRALSAQGRSRLDRLMPMVLAAAGRDKRPDATLERIVRLLDAIMRRTAYLALLAEHPMALSQLVKLCSGSPWVARFLSRHPLLLDELLDPRTLYEPLTGEALETELAGMLERVDEEDLEEQMELLRHFKNTNYLRVAAADISGALPLMVISDYLTEIAETVLRKALDIAVNYATRRYGVPQARTEDGGTEPAGYAVAAYGKLGGIELSYGSDLDLVFLHDSRAEGLATDGERGVDNQVFFARLTQRVIHILSTPTPGGVLYEVDTRLRPSGNAGLLSSSLKAFEDYQRNKAWTWEHQALVRARSVAGTAAVREGFEAVRREILQQQRDAEALRQEVRHMRERQRAEKGARDPEVFDVKQDRGGVADIEFMVQYGVLAGACEQQDLLRYTDNIRLLDALSQAGWIGAADARVLADAYRAYRARIHQLTLQELPARVPVAEFAEERDTVAAMWRRLMGAEDGE